MLPLWAVHINDGFLQSSWCVGGFIVAGLMVWVGAWRIRDDEVPRVAVFSAAFFVASLIHVPVPAGPRTHLLLNGLLGVILGRRALLAIPVGLLLQAALFGHGGWTTLGANSCVMGLPALFSWLLFAGLRRLPWIRQRWFRACLVGVSVFTFQLSAIYSITLLSSNPVRQIEQLDLTWANRVTFHPAVLLGALALSILAGWAEQFLKNAPEFPLGLLVGETAVLATIALNSMVLLWGGQEDWHTLALVTWVVHLPLAVLEGLILGFTVGFLARVKPELLGLPSEEKEPCLVQTVS